MEASLGHLVHRHLPQTPISTPPLHSNIEQRRKKQIWRYIKGIYDNSSKSEVKSLGKASIVFATIKICYVGQQSATKRSIVAAQMQACTSEK